VVLKSTTTFNLTIMSKLLLLLFGLICTTCIGQTKSWQLFGGIGISGTNQLISNNVIFENRLKYNKRNNVLDNRFKNNILHAGYLGISKQFHNDLIKDFKLNIGIGVNSFSSAFYKEEKFPVQGFFPPDDTINSPNWIVSKYSLPFIEIGLTKNFKISNDLRVDCGIYGSYFVELYAMSKVLLFDSIYYRWSRTHYYFDEEFPNMEINSFNYGVKINIVFFSDNRISPHLFFMQGLNDLSRKSINVNQHINLLALYAGLNYNFQKTNNLKNPKIIKKPLRKISLSLAGNYIYSLKWHRDSYASYYFDVPRNHTGSIQGDVLYKIGRLFSGKNSTWDDLSLGFSSEFMYLPYSGLHYVDYEFLGNINGLDQWLHHYDHDRFRFIYMINGIKGKYEIKNFGFVSFMKAYPLVLHSSGQSQDLFINNKTGAYTYGPWEKASTDRTRNPHIFTELMIGLQMTERQYFTFGFQWTARSSVNLVHTEFHVDNREQAFRNVKIGWRLGL
jgi:hypothetical protein